MGELWKVGWDEASCAGVCVDLTADARNYCNGDCVNRATDNANCGGCGMACPMGNVCSNGCSVNCQPGLSVCNAACANLQSDIANRGKCGTLCPPGAGQLIRPTHRR